MSVHTSVMSTMRPSRAVTKDGLLGAGVGAAGLTAEFLTHPFV
jgi:hypothetical protein